MASAGAAGGVASVALGHPLDSAKVLQQRDSSRSLGRIARTASLRQLYVGIGPPLLGGALESFINFGAFSATMHAMGAPSLASGSRPLASTVLCASLSGLALSAALSPFELIKVRQQSGICSSGALPCLRSLFRSEGSFGLSRGLSATALREGVGNPVIFASYDLFLSAFAPSKAPTAAHGILCGGLSGIAFYLVVLPVDQLKTFIQTGSKRSLSSTLSGVLQHCSTPSEHLRALYPGLSPVLIRAFPVNAAGWYAYELALAALGPSKEGKHDGSGIS